MNHLDAFMNTQTAKIGELSVDTLFEIVKELWLDGYETCDDAETAGCLLSRDADTRRQIDTALGMYGQMHTACCEHKRKKR